MKYILTLDIGGTNPRMAFIQVSANNNFNIIKIKNVDKNQSSIVPPINEFLEELHRENSEFITDTCCISIAGAIENNCCQNPPNAKFSINDKEILKETYLSKVLVINDFAAIGNAISIIDIEQDKKLNKIIEVKSGNINPKGNRGVIGPGTGLGVAYLINNNGNFLVSASEGGHSGIQEINLKEGLFKFLKSKLKIKQIGAEAIVSGQGIKNIFEFFSFKNFFDEDLLISNSFEDENLDTVKLISTSNIKNAKKTMNLFIKYLARASQDVALHGFTTGGIFIAGGIPAKNLDLFKDETFVSVFVDNWKQSELLKKIPIYIVIDYDISFYGCAIAVIEKFGLYSKNAN